MLAPPAGCTNNTCPPTIKAWYQGLYQYVKGKTAKATVMINAAGTEEINEWVMSETPGEQVCDIAVLVESPALTSGNTIGYLDPNFSVQSWASNYAPDRIVHTVYSCLQTNLGEVITKACGLGTGYVWVVEGDSDPNGGYSALPPYWNELVTDVDPPGVEANILGVGSPITFTIQAGKPGCTCSYDLDGGGWINVQCGVPQSAHTSGLFSTLSVGATDPYGHFSERQYPIAGGPAESRLGNRRRCLLRLRKRLLTEVLGR